jgi:hypothetical protein
MTELVEKQLVVKTIKPVELVLEMLELEKQLVVKMIEPVELVLEMLESNMTEPME